MTSFQFVLKGFPALNIFLLPGTTGYVQSIWD